MASTHEQQPAASQLITTTNRTMRFFTAQLQAAALVTAAAAPSVWAFSSLPRQLLSGGTTSNHRYWATKVIFWI